MGVKAKFVSIDMPEAQPGDSITITVEIRNVGDTWGHIRAAPDLPWPEPGYTLSPDWLSLDAGESGILTIGLVVPEKGMRLDLLAQHWTFDGDQWVTDERHTVSGGLPTNLLLIGGAILVGIVGWVIVKGRK